MGKRGRPLKSTHRKPFSTVPQADHPRHPPDPPAHRLPAFPSNHHHSNGKRCVLIVCDGLEQHRHRCCPHKSASDRSSPRQLRKTTLSSSSKHRIRIASFSCTHHSFRPSTSLGRPSHSFLRYDFNDLGGVGQVIRHGRLNHGDRS